MNEPGPLHHYEDPGTSFPVEESEEIDGYLIAIEQGSNGQEFEGLFAKLPDYFTIHRCAPECHR
jgi:hypothetical protein